MSTIRKKRLKPQGASGNEPDEYQLFETNDCDAVLPLNSSSDEITFVRFLPIQSRSDGRRQPVVIPRDTVNPDIIRLLHESDLAVDLSNENILRQFKGGVPLNQEWEQIKTPPKINLQIHELVISDPYSFLANPEFEIGNDCYRAQLTTGSLEELFVSGEALITARHKVRESTKIFIKVKWQARPEQAGGPATALIDNLEDFFSDPQIRIGKAVHKVTLMPNNVKELLSEGVTRLQLQERGSQIEVTVSAKQTLGQLLGQVKGKALIPAIERSNSQGLQKAVNDLERVMLRLDKNLANSGLHSFPLVLFMPYRQSWKLLGYTRGDILNSLSLGPEEETTIEIFTWDRRTRTREEGVSVERAAKLDLSFTDKHSRETIKELQHTEGWQTNLGGSVVIPDSPVTINAKVGFKENLSNSNKQTIQQTSEAVRRAASTIKTTRQTKVSETEESGSEERVTRKIKNPNLCHTLNLDYFEILANYRVTTALLKEQIKLCVLVPNPLRDRINRNFLLNHEGVLRNVLLFSEFQAGFDAARKLAAWERLCMVKCKPSCACNRIEIGGLIKIRDIVSKGFLSESTLPARAAVAAPANPGPASLQQPAQNSDAAAQASELLTAANNLLNSLYALANADLDGFCSPRCLTCLGSKCKKKCKKYNAEFHRWLYWQAATNFNSSLGPAAETFIASADAELEGRPIFSSAAVAKPALQTFLAGTDQSLVERLFDILTLQLKTLVDFLELQVTYPACIPKMLFKLGINDMNLPNNIQAARVALEMAALEQPPAGAGDEQPEIDDLIEQAVPDYTDKEIAEAMVAEKALIEHIRFNESYYREAIWKAMNPNDRFKILSLLGNLPDFVENEVVGFVGNHLVMPYRIREDEKISEWFKENILDNDFGNGEAENTVDVTLPTNGVMMEGRLGQCNVCEDYIVQIRELDLEQRQAEVDAAKQKALQEVQETERYKKRLQQDPPILDDPECSKENAINVILKNEEGVVSTQKGA